MASLFGKKSSSNKRGEKQISGRKVAQLDAERRERIIQLRKQREIRAHSIDYSILFLVIFLVGFGLVVLYSTSSYRGSVIYGDPAYWLKRQGAFSLIGIGLMLFISKFFDYRILKKHDIFLWIIYLSIVGLLIATLVSGSVSHGSSRWIGVGGLRFQPSEMAKLFLILYLAIYINDHASQLQHPLGLLKPLLGSLVIIGLVGYENFSTAVILVGITMVMLFVAHPKFYPFALIAAFFGGAGFLLISLKGYRMDRITAFLGTSDSGANEQTMNALYAIGSGGLFGKGLGQSMQKMILPEAYNDMIFSIICEELGLFGAICVIALFFCLIWRFMVATVNASDLLGSMIAVGVIAHIASQVFINIAVATNIIPNTGIPLPFISYGGSSMVFLLVEMGIMLSVTRYLRI